MHSIVVQIVVHSYMTSPTKIHSTTWTDGRRDLLIMQDQLNQLLSHSYVLVTNSIKRVSVKFPQQKDRLGPEKRTIWCSTRLLPWKESMSMKLLQIWLKPLLSASPSHKCRCHLLLQTLAVLLSSPRKNTHRSRHSADKLKQSRTAVDVHWHYLHFSS